MVPPNKIQTFWLTDEACGQARDSIIMFSCKWSLKKKKNLHKVVLLLSKLEFKLIVREKSLFRLTAHFNVFYAKTFYF